MENQTQSRGHGSRNCKDNLPSTRRRLFFMAAILSLFATMPFCLSAQQPETVPQKTGVAARYLGTLEASSAATQRIAGSPDGGHRHSTGSSRNLVQPSRGGS